MLKLEQENSNVKNGKSLTLKHWNAKTLKQKRENSNVKMGKLKRLNKHWNGNTLTPFSYNRKMKSPDLQTLLW